ncbi:MAG: adenylyl-sulfate kinase [Deltaproteobacteria bacterium]|nr:MAG: adenylyl-sulfate kinase [Deltaproteobacteria bacterium]
MSAPNITWHHGLVRPEERESLLGQRGAVIWLTGLSGAGKSTIARHLELLLVQSRCFAYVLDGDNLRHGLNADLGFSTQDRSENIRRVGSVAQLFSDAGVLCITAFISPFREDRAQARALVDEGRFIEVFVDTPLALCEARDPKGLYRRARAGEIAHFTGISSPYEAPENPEVHLHTRDQTPEESARQLLDALGSLRVLPPA